MKEIDNDHSQITITVGRAHHVPRDSKPYTCAGAPWEESAWPHRTPCTPPHLILWSLAAATATSAHRSPSPTQPALHQPSALHACASFGGNDSSGVMQPDAGVCEHAGVRLSLDLGLEGCEGAELNPAHACSVTALPSGLRSIPACRSGTRAQGEPRELPEPTKDSVALLLLPTSWLNKNTCKPGLPQLFGREAEVEAEGKEPSLRNCKPLKTCPTLHGEVYCSCLCLWGLI